MAPGWLISKAAYPLSRKFCLNIWLYGNVPQKRLMIQLDCLSHEGRKARKENLLNPALRVMCASFNMPFLK